MSYKFKKGDRVRNLIETGLVKIGELGTVLENNSIYPMIEWDDEEMVGKLWRPCMVKNGGVGIAQYENNLELITDENSEADHFGDANEMVGNGVYHGNTVEHWRKNAEEDYASVPISVLRYITVLEEQEDQFNPEKEAGTIHLANQMFGPAPTPDQQYFIESYWEKYMKGIKNRTEEDVDAYKNMYGAPQPNTLEWWEWHYAGMAMQGFCCNPNLHSWTVEKISNESVKQARDIIAELKKKGGGE